MKKKILAVALVATMVLSCVACAKDKGNGRSDRGSRDEESVTSDDRNEDFKYEPTGSGYRITGLSETGKTKESVVIPAGVELVGSISGGVVKHVTFESDDDVEIVTFFSNCDTLETVELPANLSVLCSFSGCSSLKEITIPENVTEIPQSCFFGCSDLETVVIEGNISEIGRTAFFKCESLKTINFPDSITTIGDSCFKGCKNVSEITLPSGLKQVGQLAFADIGLQTIIVPEDLELESWHTAAFNQMRNNYTVKVKEGSWADIHFDEVFTSTAIKEYY